MIELIPLFVAIAITLPAERAIGAAGDIKRGSYQNAQAIVAILLSPYLFRGLLISILFSEALILRNVLSEGLVIWISIIEIIVLVGSVGRMVLIFWQGRPKPLRENGLSRIVDEVRYERLHQTRKRVSLCLTLYYLAGLTTTSMLFANIYYLEVREMRTRDSYSTGDARLLVSERAREPVGLRSAAPTYDVINHNTAVYQLSALMENLAGPVSIEVEVPAQIDSESMRLMINGVLREACYKSTSKLDARGVQIHHDHNAAVDASGAYAVLIHLQDKRPAFASYSESFYDSFYMSTMTLVSVGLTDNPPVSFSMKLCVALEALVGALFFFVFLAGMLTALTG